MAADVNELSVNFEEEGVLVVKELDKEILSKGAWTTIMFRYKEWDKKKEGYGEDRYAIRRYQKFGEEYRQKAKFNISSRDQAQKMIEVLTRWVKTE